MIDMTDIFDVMELLELLLSWRMVEPILPCFFILVIGGASTDMRSTGFEVSGVPCSETREGEEVLDSLGLGKPLLEDSDKDGEIDFIIVTDDIVDGEGDEGTGARAAAIVEDISAIIIDARFV